MIVDLTYEKLAAMYFALLAAREGKSGVFIHHDDLKYYLLDDDPKRRLSRTQLKAFARDFEPIFPKAVIVEDSVGLGLELQLKPHKPQTNSLMVRLLPRTTILDVLGMAEVSDKSLFRQIHNSRNNR